MDELRDLARRGPVADFVEESGDADWQRRSTGLSLRLDPCWVSWWNAATQHPYWPPAAELDRQRGLRLHGQGRYDFSHKPGDWPLHCKRHGLREGSHPVAIVVILREALDGGKIPEDWPRYVKDHPIIYEHRPQAELLAVAPGHSVSGATTGTLGGYLWRQSDGQHFALSCAHVFGQVGAPQVQAANTPFGSVVESHFPPICTGKCNNRIPGGISAHAVDAAVVDLTGNPTMQLTVPGVGKVAAVTPIAAIGQGDAVELVGAKSGKLKGNVKECNVWREITFNGQKYCFGDLLVVEDITYHYIAGSFCQPGDSGAWILNQAAGHVSWDGMLIGGDGANAYCSYAENIVGLIDPGLSLPP